MPSLDCVSRLGLPPSFPNFFPRELELYRRSIVEATDTPDEYGVAYMLAAAATAAGAEVSACVQPGWYVRANLFLAVVGHKGSGKSTLADRCFGPLISHEEQLRFLAEQGEDDAGDDFDDYDNAGDLDDEYGDGLRDGNQLCLFATQRRSKAAKKLGGATPCVLVNDCSGPALLQLLDQNRRQLLFNTDELAALFSRKGKSVDRAMLCELYDGRRRVRKRAASSTGSATLDAPYMSLIGGIQPDLVRDFYNPRGDDGLLDRILLVGDGEMREADWPRDTDDPALNTAWSTALARLLRVEWEASDAIGQQVESRFTPAAREVCKGLLTKLKNLVVLLGVPNAQRGVVKKLSQHALKLALLHRLLRWAGGEFGDVGPVGDVDSDDAVAACQAVLFFFGRWIIWRPELRGGIKTSTEAIGLSGSPGDDLALQVLSEEAAGAQRNVSLIERLVRFLRSSNAQSAELACLTATTVFEGVPLEELQDVGDWLVDHGFAEWEQSGREVIKLTSEAGIWQPDANGVLVTGTRG